MDGNHTILMARLRKYAGLHLFRVLVAPLTGLPPVAVAHPELQYAALSLDTALAWAADPDLDLDPAEVRAAYGRGDVCVGASENGVPVGYQWFAFHSARHADCWIELGRHIRYSYKAYIRPAYRGRRISQELYTRAGEICPRRGRTLQVLMIYVDNAVSLRASRRAGRRVVGYAGYVKAFGRVLPFRSPGARRLGFRFVPREPPARAGPMPDSLPAG